ncbi:PDZ domain (Also known as DHR or GLGF) [Novipirellula galeiformis]|uniref:PDZ domain (Also known as DHR or GLGF) n=1 Tax=Novipirellula galeiformis TaxID=2528004 RepID=A0A5C6CMQ1_9BACT|nr:PDZ domain-containing protein [Novipirellula galeiformis]TWU25355.1 PDZ domain (Also known as DHR or GLGF) [Novipirellula galeiformis]
MNRSRYLWMLVLAALVWPSDVRAQPQAVQVDTAQFDDTAPGTRIVSETYRLGFMAHAQPGLGLVVDSVTPNGPATRITRTDGSNRRGILEVGDVITAVDGVPLNSMDDYYRAMDRSKPNQGRVMLTIMDVNSGRRIHWSAQGDLVHIANRPNLDDAMVYRLQFRGMEVPGGIRIDQITPNGPLTKLTNRDGAITWAEVGDVLTSLNGVPVQSFPQFFQLMEQARATGGFVNLTLRDINTGRLVPLRAQAVLVNSGVPLTNGDRKIHVLICGLTEDQSIGEAISRSVDALSTQIQTAIAPEFVGSFREITGPECNATAIIRAVNSIQTSPNDTLFCYYLGHGAYDPARAGFNDPSQGHFFQIPSGDLMRHELWDRLRRKGTRLTTLITDTCNVQSIARPRSVLEQRMTQTRINDFTPLERLLLFNRGEIDISASSRDEFSWFTSSLGGWFTYNLCQRINKDSDWDAFLNTVSQNSNAYFQQRKMAILANPGNTASSVLNSLRGQQNMRPQAFRFAVNADPYRGNPPTGPRTLSDSLTVETGVN